MAVPTITSIEPYAGSRGASGTLITINGTNFEALQGTGSVTIGAVAVIVASWSDTQITCRADDDPATPLGAQDVIVTNGTGDSLTLKDAFHVYDATDTVSDSELEVGNISVVYVDGRNVGQLQGGVEIVGSQRLLPYKPAHKNHVTFMRVLEKNATVSVTLDQINGDNLELLLNGTYASASKILTVTSTGTGNLTEHSVYMVDEAGWTYFIPRCRIPALGSLMLSPDSWKGIPLTFEAIPTDDAQGLVLQMKDPA